MNILVLNCGSSSIKAEVINAQTGKRPVAIQVERILDAPTIHFNGDKETIICPEIGHEKVLPFAIEKMLDCVEGLQIDGVGHRVVHGGDKFDEAVMITAEVEAAIEALNDLAPLHNPVNLQGIRIAKKLFPAVKHVAVFDTAFHHTLPRRARTYAIPQDLADKYGIRRYGFHGTSHAYVADLAADYLRQDISRLRLITCHLGSGCSVAAIEYGRCIETSMGMTPLEGLVMGTRSGDIDAGILPYLAEKENLSIAELDELLNKKSGLAGLSGRGNDMRDIIEKASEGDEKCRLAIQVFAHRVKKYIGAYATIMNGVDAIVFTGGIGENSSIIRHRVAQQLEFLGILQNEDKNHDVKLTAGNPVADFAMNHSRVRLLAIKTDEQLSIAQQAAKLVEEKHKVNTIPPIPIAISARHMHITQETLEHLFGAGYQLTVRKPLSQPNQFAANETVTIVGPKKKIERVRILGPVRSKNQIEISRTDEFVLGIDAPIRESGRTENSAGVKVIGPKGEIMLQDGLICAWRHIHMTPLDAEIFGVNDRDIVEVKVGEGDRVLTFGNVLIRVSPKYLLEMHIDTDEGNAAEIMRGVTGALVQTDGVATLKKRRL